MKLPLLLFTLLAAFLAGLLLPAVSNAQYSTGKIVFVNDSGDSRDARPGDGICADASGKCTLRAAIDETNTTTAADAIVFDVPVPAVIELTLGELKTTNDVGIYGRGTRQLTIRRSPISTTNFRIFHFAQHAHVRGMTIAGGHAAVGGGILAEKLADLYDLAIVNNRADRGGGIALTGANSGVSVIDRCLIASNVADDRGGGVSVQIAAVSIKDSTLTGNAARTSGGAIFNEGSVYFSQNTVTRNSASEEASSIQTADGSFQVINSIIGPDLDPGVTTVKGWFQSELGNFVTNITGSSGWMLADQTSTNNTIDPMLGPLSDNGGPTDTMAPLPGSPVIDRGDFCTYSGQCPWARFLETAKDQRRFMRTGRPDAGSVENGTVLNILSYPQPLCFDRTQRLANSPVVVTNIETMEIRRTRVRLFNSDKGIGGCTETLQFTNNYFYVAEVETKRNVFGSPMVLSFDWQ